MTECALDGCSEPVLGRKRRFCSDRHRNVYSSRDARKYKKFRMTPGHICSHFCIPLEVK